MALSTEGTIAGTLQYMSPEQLQGKEADGRSDIFAFGLTFYEILTDAGHSMATMQPALFPRS